MIRGRLFMDVEKSAVRAYIEQREFQQSRARQPATLDERLCREGGKSVRAEMRQSPNRFRGIQVVAIQDQEGAAVDLRLRRANGIGRTQRLGLNRKLDLDATPDAGVMEISTHPVVFRTEHKHRAGNPRIGQSREGIIQKRTVEGHHRFRALCRSSSLRRCEGYFLSLPHAGSEATRQNDCRRCGHVRARYATRLRDVPIPLTKHTAAQTPNCGQRP